MAKRVHRQMKHKKKDQASKRFYWIVGTALFIIIGLLIVVIINVLPSNGQQQADNIIVPTEIQRNTTQDNTAGNPDAPVTLEVFSNYECSHCKSFAEEVEPLIIEDYVNTGKVYLIHNSMSWDESKSAQAAYCAMDQDKFWPYHDILFANQTNAAIKGIANENLSKFAAKLGLDTRQFEQCLSSNKYENKIETTQTEAYENGITGTPMFIINGELVSSYHAVIDTIDQDLAEMQ